jgi:outer membrane lipoprotein carrier protein
MMRVIPRLVVAARNVVIVLGVLTLSLPLPAAFAQSVAIDRMIESLAATQTMTADFSQMTSAKTTRVRQSSGTFWIAKPGLLRWEVKKPYPQLQVLNEKEFWVFDPDLAQASVRPVAAASLTGIAALLLNSNTLSREELAQRYRFAEAGKRDGLTWIMVTPQMPEPGVTQLLVGINDDAELRKFEITDSLGQVTRVDLSNIFKNASIDPRLFRFSPPSGVSVLRAP